MSAKTSIQISNKKIHLICEGEWAIQQLIFYMYLFGIWSSL